MLNIEYREALVEVLEILNYLDTTEKNKIPDYIIKFYETNKSNTYKPNLFLNCTDEFDINNLNLKNKSREILAGLYLDYLCNTEEERNIYLKKLNTLKYNYEKSKSEKYDSNNIFKNRTRIDDSPVSKEKSLIRKNKKNIFERIFEKIKSLFKK